MADGRRVMVGVWGQQAYIWVRSSHMDFANVARPASHRQMGNGRRPSINLMARPTVKSANATAVAASQVSDDLKDTEELRKWRAICGTPSASGSKLRNYAHRRNTLQLVPPHGRCHIRVREQLWHDYDFSIMKPRYFFCLSSVFLLSSRYVSRLFALDARSRTKKCLPQ